MKYLKTYNERLGDKLNAPSDDEIWNKMKVLDSYDIIKLSIKNNYLKGFKYVFDNNKNIADSIIDLILLDIFKIKDKDILQYLTNNEIFKNYLNEDNLYIIEKFNLGLHQNEKRNYEIELDKIFNNIKNYKSVRNPKITVYSYDLNVFMNSEIKNKIIQVYVDRVIIKNILMKNINIDNIKDDFLYYIFDYYITNYFKPKQIKIYQFFLL